MLTHGSDLLREYAERTRRNQCDLAAYLDLTEAHLSQFLSRKRNPGLPIAARIEDRTGVPMRSWLDNGLGGKFRKRARRPRNKPKIAQISEVLSHGH